MKAIKRIGNLRDGFSSERRKHNLANEHNVDMEDVTLSQAKDQLLEKGKKQGVLTYKTIMEKLSGFDQDSQQMDDFFEHLSEQGIEVINENEEEFSDPENSQNTNDPVY